MRKIDYIIVHHSLSKDGKRRNFDAIRKYHMNHNGWTDIGYHYVVEKYGKGIMAYYGRPPNVVGAHVKGMNQNTLGICVVGNFDRDEVPEDIWEHTIQVVKALQDDYEVLTSHVLGHWEAQKKQGIVKAKRKSCPGKNFNMSKFREDLDG